MSLRRSSIVNSPSLIIFSRIVSGGLGLVSALLIARSLGPAGRGTTAGALAVLGLLPLIVGLGTPLVVRRIASNPDQVDLAIRAARVIALLTLTPSLLLAWATTALIPELQEDHLFVAFMAAAAVTPLAVLWICSANVLVAFGRNGHFALTNVISPAVSTAAICVGAVAGQLSAAYVIWAALAATVANYMFTSVVVRVSWRGPHTSVAEVLRQGATFAGSQVSEAASYRLDQAIALPLIGSEAAGLYSVAATIALVPYSLGQAIGAAAYRHLATALSPHEVRARSSAVVRIAFLSGTTTAILLAVASPLLVPAAFGPSFGGAVVPTLVSLVGSIAVVVTYVASSALTAAGKGWSMTLGQLIALVSGSAALFALGPLLGATGASIASTFGYWAGTVVLLIGLGTSPSSLVPRLRDIRATARMLLYGAL